MARTVEVAPPAGQKRPAPPRRTRVLVKKVGPWSLFRFSLLFYFCIMVAVWIGLAILYAFLNSIGVLDSIEKGLRNIGFAKTWEFHGWWILSRLFMIGLVMVVFGSIVNLFAAFLYNLIAEFVGGVEITLAERR